MSNIRTSGSYRALLPNDIFMLNNGDTVVLVVDYNSFGFKKIINHCIDDDILQSHSRQQRDKTKYEFSMKLTAFSIKDAVLDGSISPEE